MIKVYKLPWLLLIALGIKPDLAFKFKFKFAAGIDKRYDRSLVKSRVKSSVSLTSEYTCIGAFHLLIVGLLIKPDPAFKFD